MSNPIKVSIHCLVYNQAPYLRQCLDGFLMQKTSFLYEIVVHDDVSTDESADIIREYAENYPDIVKPILETENQYSKNDGSLERIMIKACTGEYIALCEGDDYWTDPIKLQKQIDFLDSHPDYSMCFHNAISHWDKGEHDDSLFSNIEDRPYSGLEIFEKWTVPTASVVFRRTVLESKIFNVANSDSKFCFGDIVMFLSCAACGKVFGMSDVMCVYRRHEGSAIYPIYNLHQHIRNSYHCLEIYKVFGIEYKALSIEKFYKNGMEAFLNAKAKGEIHYKLLYDLVRYAPKRTFSAFWRMLKKGLK